MTDRLEVLFWRGFVVALVITLLIGGWLTDLPVAPERLCRC